jgi:proteasome-associated ATPase
MPDHSDETRAQGSHAGSRSSARAVEELREEIEMLRAKVSEAPRHLRALEDRLAEAHARAGALADRNERLTATLRDAREQLLALREEVDRLAQPPSGYGVFLDRFEDGTVDIFTGGRKLRVAVSPDVDKDGLHYGQEVMLNEAMNVVRCARVRAGRRSGDAEGDPLRAVTGRWSSGTQTRNGLPTSRVNSVTAQF